MMAERSGSSWAGLRWLLGFALLLALAGAARAAPAVALVELAGPVSPASAGQFSRALQLAVEQDMSLLVLKLDTPGGLDSSMRDMLRAILASSVPVATYVAPSGARAASAGTYILYASHLAAMAPGTNLGAATPVQVGAAPKGDRDEEKDGGDTLSRKAVQDAAAYLRSLAQLRGRNKEWAEAAVLRSESLSAEEALAQGVIDLMAADVPELLERVHGRKLRVGQAERVLDTRGARVVVVESTARERVLAAIANPNVALLLLALGFYALLFEFYSPGFGLPGLVGAICLLLGAYGLQLLPVSYVAVLLILLGLALMGAEAFAGSGGLLGAGGAVSFVAGALMLIDREIPGFQVSPQLIVALAALTGVALFVTGTLALRARRRPALTGREEMIGGVAEALEDFEREGHVLLHGERWRAVSRVPLRKGQRARVAGLAGLTLELEPIDQPATGEPP